MFDLVLRNAKAFGWDNIVDIAVVGGKISKVGPELEIQGRIEIDCSGFFVSPGLIDIHTHLDKAFIYDRAPKGTRPQKLEEAISDTRRLKEQMSSEDVKERALKFLKLAVCNGTTRARTFVEADSFIEMRAVEGILEAKKEAKGFMELETVAFAQEGWFHTPGTLEDGCEDYLIRAMEQGLDIIGGNVNTAVWKSSGTEQIDRMFAIAERFNCPIDMHLDNSDSAKAFCLPYLAEKTIERGYQGRVSAGHVVGISHVEDDLAFSTIEKVREAGINIVVLPTRIRLTRVMEFLRNGVNLTVGTDNIRDFFMYLGNADMLEAMLLLSRILKIGSDADLVEIFKMGTVNAARAMNLKDYGISEGNRADLVVFQAKSPAEAIMTMARRLYVIKDGNLVAKDGEFLG